MFQLGSATIRCKSAATLAGVCGTRHAFVYRMTTNTLYATRSTTSANESWLALGSAVLLLMYGATRRSPAGAIGAAAATPLLYRGITGHWPTFRISDDSKTALRGERGIRVREAIRLERPLSDVYRFWRRLENLPLFMSHLHSVTEGPGNRSHWVAAGLAGFTVEWDAEIINEVENHTLAWQSLPGSDVVSAGSVNFDAVRGGSSTQVTVHLQYAPPAGRAGNLLATLFGRAPAQTIREDLRRVKQLLETGEVATVARAESRA